MSKQIVEVFNKKTTRVKSIAFHPTNSVLITANHCGTVYLWNYLFQQIIAVLHEHTGSVRTVKIHPSGELFATAGDDKVIRIWNYKTRTVVQKLKGHTDFVRSIDFHPTKPWIVSGSDDFTIRVWNFHSGEQLSTSCGQTHYIMSVLFLDSTHILSGSLDHTMSLWSCANLFEKKKFLVPEVVVLQQIEAHSRGVNTLFLAENILLSGSDDREIKIWRFSNDSISIDKSIYAHEGIVNAVFYKNGIIYAGGEDNVLSITKKGKTQKIPLNSRIWSISGRDEYFAVGTDDGLVFYRDNQEISYAIEGEENIYYSLGNKVFKYNNKQSIDLFTTRYDITEMIVNNGILYVMYDGHYEAFIERRKEESDEGTVIFVRSTRYQIKQNSLYKNNELFRSNVKGRMFTDGNVLLIVDKKTVTRIENDTEMSSSFSFSINSISFCNFNDSENGIQGVFAVIGTNKIQFVDRNFTVIETLNELVEITGGFFHEDLFIYSTLRHLKFFYQGIGILQSIENYSIPIAMRSENLILLTAKGIDKILLNLSEIRFRRAVFKDENILSVIEEEQLPGLSPLEYLISKNKGGIALPYIQNDEKRFQLFLSDKNFDEALKLSNTFKMNEELAFSALASGRYDISEICFKKNQDNLNLFYLYLSTKQLNKMKDLEGDDVENMVKVILEDKTVLNQIFNNESFINGGGDDDKAIDNDKILNSLKNDNKTVDNSDKGKSIKMGEKSNTMNDKSIAMGDKAITLGDKSRTLDDKVITMNDKSNNNKTVYNSGKGKSITMGDKAITMGDNSTGKDKVMNGVIEKDNVNDNTKGLDKAIGNKLGKDKSRNNVIDKDNNNEKMTIEDKALIDRNNINDNTKGKDKAGDTSTVSNKVNDSTDQPIDELSSMTLPDLTSLNISETKFESSNLKKNDNERGDRNGEENDKDSEPGENELDVNDKDSELSDSDNKLNDRDSELANNKDLSDQNDLFDISVINVDRSLDYETAYQEALDFTTQGKFLKAIDSFRTSIALIALRIENPSDYLDLRKRIGNYLLGLYIEKERKKVEDPLLSVEMSLFFASLDLDPVHMTLVKNLALTNCYKHGNYKTAKEIAREFPDCRNASKVLGVSEDFDTLPYTQRPFVYGSLKNEGNVKECKLCRVKSTGEEMCPACLIGVLRE